MPPPAPWQAFQDDDGDTYYHNFETGESVWDHPCDTHYRKLFEEEKRKRRELSERLASLVWRDKGEDPSVAIEERREVERLKAFIGEAKQANGMVTPRFRTARTAPPPRFPRDPLSPGSPALLPVC